ncbi:MAG TPA: hypothetical protein VGJ29_11195 [Vicinamibacterales bacterium]|jgi:hypothetical protein
MPTRSDAAVERADALGRPLVLLAATLALRLPALVRPYFFSSDEAVYSALAVRMLHGVDPYVGAVDHKPVGVDLLYAAVYAVTGPNHMFAIHILLVLIVWSTALVLARAAVLVSGNRAACLAGLFYVCASAAGMPRDVQPANTELLLNLPTAVALWLVCRAVVRPVPAAETEPRDHLGLLAAAGVLTAVAGLFKYQASLVGVAWAVAVVQASGASSRTLRQLTALAAGFLAIAAGLCGYFYFRGEWDAFTFWGWRYNFSYIAALSAREKEWNLVRRTGTMMLFWLPLVTLAIVAARRRALPLVVIAWLACECIAVSVGGRFFLYYYLIALPPLAVAAAIGAAAATMFRPGRRFAGSAGRAVAVLAAVSIVASATLAWTWQTIQPDFRREHDVESAVGDYVRTHSAPDDRLFVWGNASQIYYFANRVMGTRFAFCNYHTGKIWGSWAYAVDAGDTSMFIVPRAWAELLDDLDRTPPAFIVDTGAGRLASFDRHPIGRYKELAERVARDYRLDAVVAGVPIYRRQAR